MNTINDNLPHLLTNIIKWYVVRVYMPTNDQKTVPWVKQDLERCPTRTDMLLVGDLNARLTHHTTGARTTCQPPYPPWYRVPNVPIYPRDPLEGGYGVKMKDVEGQDTHHW